MLVCKNNKGSIELEMITLLMIIFLVAISILEMEKIFHEKIKARDQKFTSKWRELQKN